MPKIRRRVGHAKQSIMKKILIVFSLLLSVCVNAQTVVPCPQCGGYGMINTYYGVATCPNCGGAGGFVIDNTNTNGSNVTFKSNGNQSDGFEYLRDVSLYTYNINTQKYVYNRTCQLYKYWTGRIHLLYLDKQWSVLECSYPTSKQFKYFVVDRWGVTYYFN